MRASSVRHQLQVTSLFPGVSAKDCFLLDPQDPGTWDFDDNSQVQGVQVHSGCTLLSISAENYRACSIPAKLE